MPLSQTYAKQYVCVPKEPVRIRRRTGTFQKKSRRETQRRLKIAWLIGDNGQEGADGKLIRF